MTSADYDSRPAAASPESGADPDSHSLGDLVSRLSSDLSRLMRQELELAKTEVKEEAARAGKGAGLLGGAGLAGWMCALFLSLTAMWAIGHGIDLAWAALIVAAVWAAVGAVLYGNGRTTLRSVNPKPEHTIETLKEDAQWAKHPRS